MFHRLLVLGVILLVGCSPIEMGKTIWGSSTRSLQEARVNAIAKVYTKPYWETVKAVLDVIQENQWEIFIQDEVRGVIVIMGIRGSVNTTEVGLFFVEESPEQTRLEIASLSTNAKEIVAKHLLRPLEFALGLDVPTPEELEDRQQFIKQLSLDQLNQDQLDSQ